MTSPPPPAPGNGPSAGQILRPLRDLAAYVLAGATALFLLVALIRLVPSAGEYSYQSQDVFYDFVNVATVGFPLAAVMLALMVQPRHPKANLIVLAAVVEYAVAAFFGVLFGLIGVVNHASHSGAGTALEQLLVRVGWLAVLGVAAYGIFLIWRGMFQVARPRPQPGVYGQPPQANPGAYPGQPGYPAQHQPFSQGAPYPQQPPPPPGFAAPGQGNAGYGAPNYGAPNYGAPDGAPNYGAPNYGGPDGAPNYGGPDGAPNYGGPDGAPKYGSPDGASNYGGPEGGPGYGQGGPAWNPTSAPPGGTYGGGPTSAPPQSGNYGTYGGGPTPADPTRITPPSREPSPIDRTEPFRDDRPGFGPAAQDPPRY